MDVKKISHFYTERNNQYLKNDTLFIYNDFSEKGKLDTIITQNGSFTYTTRLDTITPLTLLINETTEYPIYADKNLKVTVDGDANMIESFIIEGGVHNEDLNEFHKSINGKHNKNWLRLKPTASSVNIPILMQTFI